MLFRTVHGGAAPLAVIAVTRCLAAGCGGTETSTSALSAATDARPDWADRANAICVHALPDAGHEMVRHLDSRHVKQHGMSIVDAGSKLDALGAPTGADADSYAKMIAMYKQSAIVHGLVLRELDKGNGGNAAMEYSYALALADKADGLAGGFGAVSCNRFGMDS